MTEPLLRIDALDYHVATHSVLRGLTLAFDSGLTWLRGANGAGKTTLLKLVGGVLAPAGGRLRIDNIDSAAAPIDYRLCVHYCGGDVPALPWLRAREWLDLHLALYGTVPRAELDRRMAAFGVARVLDQTLNTLSLGQHRKLQLALALSLPVRVLLLDEPFNGLDAAAVDLLREELLARMGRGQDCMLLTSHGDPGLTGARQLDLDTLPDGTANPVTAGALGIV
jgi:ABC-2 type transport system ATP-binding protein